MKNRMTRSALMLWALAIVAACGGGGSEKKADTQTAAATPKANGNTFTIAMIAKSSTNPVFLAARTGAEAAAKDLSAKTGKDIRVNWLTPPQEDGQVQAQRVQQAVNDGADDPHLLFRRGQGHRRDQRRREPRRPGHDVRQRCARLQAVRVLWRG